MDPTGHATQKVKSDADNGPKSSHGEVESSANKQPDNAPTVAITAELLHKILLIRFDSRLSPGDRKKAQALILGAVSFVNGKANILSPFEKQVYGLLKSVGVTNQPGRPSIDPATGSFTHTLSELAGGRVKWTATVLGHDAFHVYQSQASSKAVFDRYLLEFEASIFQLGLAEKFKLNNDEKSDIRRFMDPTEIDKRYAEPVAPPP